SWPASGRPSPRAGSPRFEPRSPRSRPWATSSPTTEDQTSDDWQSPGFSRYSARVLFESADGRLGRSGTGEGRTTMKIDIYNHIFPKRFYDSMMEVMGSPKDMLKRVTSVPMLVDLDERFRVMDRFKDYCQVLS